MFWRLGFQQSSPIDAILERDKFEIEDLLDEDDLLQECKSYNRKLITYLSNADVVGRLIAYSITEPSPDAEAKVRLKYPHIATEILTGDLQAIYDTVFANENLSLQLFKFLEGPGPDNALLAGYFCKIVVALLARKPTETLAALKAHDVLGSCLEHLATYSMAEVIVRVIVEVEDTAARSSTPVEPWLVEYNMMLRLVEKLDPSQPSQVHQNVGTCVSNIIRETSRSSSSVFFSQLTSADATKRLLDNIFSGSSSALMAGLLILADLLRMNFPSEVPNALIIEVLARLGDFKKLLEQPPPMAPITNTAETLDPPLGANRLMVVEVLMAMTSSDDRSMDETIISSGILQSCLDLFMKYQWNNLLHNHVSMFLANLFPSRRIRLALMEDDKMVEWILAAYARNEEYRRTVGSRIGYAGHLHVITNAFTAYCLADDDLKARLGANARWMAYLTNEVIPRRDLECRQLGGHKPATTTGRGGVMDSLPSLGLPETTEETTSSNNNNSNNVEGGADTASDASWRPRDAWLTEEEQAAAQGTAASEDRSSKSEPAATEPAADTEKMEDEPKTEDTEMSNGGSTAE